jgi:IS605 OrfB family transposase
MTDISKNIYNNTLFIYKVYNIYQNDIHKDVYNFIITNNLHIKYIKTDNIEKNKYEKYNKKAKKTKKTDDIILITDYFYSMFDKYYKFYVNNKKNIDSNNQIIYKYIISDIKNNDIIISNNNYNKIINKYINEVVELEDIIFNNDNKNITIDNIVKSIVKSLYIKNYFYIKKQIENKYKVDDKYKDVIEVINNNQYIYDNNENLTYRNKIIKELNINFSSIENLINRLSYKYIETNKEKLPSDVIINIIAKAYGNIKSYYALLKSGKQSKTNISKFLDKEAKFNLFYYCRSFKKLDDGIRLNVGEYVNKNYNLINKDNNYKSILINNKIKYYNENNLINITESKIKKDNKKDIFYTKINDKYINNDNIYSYNYIYLSLPKKIEYENIKLIEIVPINNKIKVCITYEKIFENPIIDYDMDNYNSLSIEDKLKKTLSIDTGIKNLFTIYDPIGKQHIIKGGTLLSINHFYNKKIDYLNSINKKLYNKSKYKRLDSLLEERERKIKGHFNQIINKIVNTYKDKEVFIIGYNPNWKHKTNMGKKNNRNFYQIAYKQLIEKLEEKLKCINKKMVLVKESYTSKCDALALESIRYHETYLGNRKKRGLFESSTQKLINADLNGAINIMRKYVNLNYINQTNICNPTVIKIYDTKL